MLTDPDKLRNFDLQSFLNDLRKHNIFVLKKKYGNISRLLADQLLIYKKAADKLPFFADKCCYFTKKGFEQSSSEQTAIYKSALFSGEIMLDLTGGLGVDDWAFAKTFKKIISVEKDPMLNELVRINFEKLGVTNIERLDTDTCEYIKKNNFFDLIYIDADRRASVKKAITLENSEPDILDIISRLFQLSNFVLLKLSPLIDITYLKRKLANIMVIHAVSVNNEVKEVLATLQKDYRENTIINAVDLIKNKPEKIFTSFGEKSETIISDQGKYLYEPSASIIKAGLVNEYAAINGLNAISHNSVFLTGNNHVKDFMGRAFAVTTKILFSKSAVKKYLKNNGIVKVNVSCRNFPVKEDMIKKIFGLKDGGEEYLFFTSGNDKQKLMFHCKKILQ